MSGVAPSPILPDVVALSKAGFLNDVLGVVKTVAVADLTSLNPPPPAGTLLRDPTTGLIYGQSDGNGSHLPFKSARLHGDIRAQITADSSKMSIHAVSGVVSTAPGHLFGGWFVNPGTDGSVKFYDNASAASGRVLYESTSAEVVRAGWTYISADGVDTDNGIYIELSGTANPTVLVWFEGEYPEAVDWTGVTERYFDGVNGNNSWDGLAPEWDGVSGPKQHMRDPNGINFSVGNHSINLKRGTEIRLGRSSGSSTSFLSSTKVRIRAYGDESLPRPVLYSDETDNNAGFGNQLGHYEVTDVVYQHRGTPLGSGTLTLTAPLVDAVRGTLTAIMSAGTYYARLKLTFGNGEVRWGGVAANSTTIEWHGDPVTCSDLTVQYVIPAYVGNPFAGPGRIKLTRVHTSNVQRTLQLSGSGSSAYRCTSDGASGGIVLGIGDMGPAINCTTIGSYGNYTCVHDSTTQVRLRNGGGTADQNAPATAATAMLQFYSADEVLLTARLASISNASPLITFAPAVTGAVNKVKVCYSAYSGGALGNTITFNPAPSGSSATLSSNWTGYTGWYPVQLFVGGVGAPGSARLMYLTNGQSTCTFNAAVPGSAEATAWRCGPAAITETKFALVRECEGLNHGGEGAVQHDGIGCFDNVMIACTAAPAYGGSTASALDLQAAFNRSFVAYNDFDASDSPYLLDDDHDAVWWVSAGGGTHMNVGEHTYLGNRLTVRDGKNNNAFCFSRTRYSDWIGNYFKQTQAGGALYNQMAAKLALSVNAHHNKVLFNTFDLRNNRYVVMQAGYSGMDDIGVAQENVEFKGNIIIHTGNPTADVPLVKVRAADLLTWDIDNNCYYTDHSGGNYLWTEGAGPGAGTITKYTLTDWRAIPGAGSPDASTLTVNPNLTADGKLPAGSPLIGAGPRNSVCYLLPFGPVWHKGSASIGMHDPQS